MQPRAGPLGHAEFSRSKRGETPYDAKQSRWRAERCLEQSASCPRFGAETPRIGGPPQSASAVFRQTVSAPRSDGEEPSSPVAEQSVRGTSNPAWKGKRTKGSASDKCHFLKENGVSDRDDQASGLPVHRGLCAPSDRHTRRSRPRAWWLASFELARKPRPLSQYEVNATAQQPTQDQRQRRRSRGGRRRCCRSPVHL